MKPNDVRNIRIAGLGGMGILKSSQILAEVLFRAGFDIKKAEVHGMSQRGGSVASDIRFGSEVLSPMIPDGETDYLLALTDEELEVHRRSLRGSGIVIGPAAFAAVALPNKKSLNIAMLGALSRHLAIPTEAWISMIRAVFPEKLQAVNVEAFELGRQAIQ